LLVSLGRLKLINGNRTSNVHSHILYADDVMLINGNRTSNVHSHILYADDVMLFCKGTSSDIQVLSEFFQAYAHISG